MAILEVSRGTHASRCFCMGYDNNPRVIHRHGHFLADQLLSPLGGVTFETYIS